MSRAGRARKVAAAAAYGGGGLTALTALGVGVITAEVKLARRWIGQPFGAAHSADGVYGEGPGDPIELAVLGDSSAAGLGADAAEHTPGAVVARGLAAAAARPVRLTSVAVVGAESADMDGQIDRLLAQVPQPAIAFVMIGANDVTHRVRPAVSGRHLGHAVARLRRLDCQVVVGTCPDLGTIEPVAQPLSLIARRWSRDLAAAQTVPSSRPAAAASRSAACWARSSAAPPARCSAPTGSTRAAPGTPRPPRPCCPASAPRSASGRTAAPSARRTCAA